MKAAIDLNVADQGYISTPSRSIIRILTNTNSSLRAQYRRQAAIAGHGDAAYFIAREHIAQEEHELAEEWLQFALQAHIRNVHEEEIDFAIGMCAWAKGEYQKVTKRKK
jgi:hypothetical protein